MSEQERCPKCGVSEIGRHDLQIIWKCGSRLTDDQFVQSPQCELLAHIRSKDDAADSLRNVIAEVVAQRDALQAERDRLKAFANVVIERAGGALRVWDRVLGGCKDHFAIDLYLTAGELRSVQPPALSPQPTNAADAAESE